jgi:HK97 family phage portal protein
VVEKHYSIDLLETPNDRENKRRFIKSWAINRLLTGDAFTYFEKGVGLKLGGFKAMYIMPSQKVDILKGGLTKPLAGYKIDDYPDMQNIKLDDTNVMMSFEPNPNPDTFYGLSPLRSAANYIQLLEAGLKRQNSSITNGGAANIITPKPDNYGSVTETQAQTAETELNANKNVNKNKFIKVPIEVHPLGDKPIDLGIIDSSKDAVTALCFVYNIPIDMYYGQAKYDNTKEAKKSVYEQAAIPLFNEFLQDYNKFLNLKKEGLAWKLNTDKIEVLREDINVTLDAYAKMNASVNEKRELMGFARVEQDYADQPMIPLGVSFGEATFTDISEV